MTIVELMPYDKTLHALGGDVLFVAGRLAATAAGQSPDIALAAGMGLCVVGAVSKEIYDVFHPNTHTADWRDAVATIAGGALGALARIG